ALGAQHDVLIEAHPFPDYGGFADYDARAVIDEETRPDLCGGVDVDAGGRVGDVRYEPREEGRPELVYRMCHPVMGDGFDARIGQQDFRDARSGGVALVGGVQVAYQHGADGGELGL